MWTFGKKIALGFALSFLLLLVIGGVSYNSISTLTQTSYAVSRFARGAGPALPDGPHRQRHGEPAARLCADR